MTGLLNPDRPPFFCPGCSHENMVTALDEAFNRLGLSGDEIAIVTDIGCCGLIDTYFNTHAFHGLHGRVLTYASGIKMASPGTNVIAVSGDGGVGIGGAHLIAACKRNINLTLLVLNNFNYGMTGGQFSPTTPPEASVSSAFLNDLEVPLDIAGICAAAGAPFTARTDAGSDELVEIIKDAISYNGFSVVDIWGICTGRYAKKNRTSYKKLRKRLAEMPDLGETLKKNRRKEYCTSYRKKAASIKPAAGPARIIPFLKKPFSGTKKILFLGAAGQRIQTAAEVLCLGAASAGLFAVQKNDYPITVLRGHSISEVVLSDEPILFAGIDEPDVVILLSEEGAKKRGKPLSQGRARIFVPKGKELQSVPGRSEVMDLDDFPTRDRSLAALGWLAARGEILDPDLLFAGITHRFEGDVREKAENTVKKAMQKSALR